MPVPPADLVDRLIASDAAYTRGRIGCIAAEAENRFGVALRRDGATHAFRIRDIPVPSFNRAIGLERPDLVGHLANWFDEAGVQARFDIVPPRHTPELAEALASCGARQTGFGTMFWARPDDIEASRPGTVAIETVESPEMLEVFIDTLLTGWRLSSSQQGAKRNMRRWLDVEGWTLLLARIGGQPAGSAVLSMHEGIAYCSDASTDPAWRGRGVQSALLRHRGTLAREAGAEFIWSGADFGGASYRNMLRVGLRVLCTPAYWTRDARSHE